MSETIREFLLKGEKNKDFVMTDIPKHGLVSGIISQLIYYKDIDKFYNKHIDEVWDEVNELGGLIEIIKDEKNQPTDPSHFNYLMVCLAVENIACHICNEREDDRERIAEKNRNIQRVDAQVKGVKW